MTHLYSALFCIAVHLKRFTIMWGGGGGVSPQPPPMCSKQGRTGHLMANFKSHQKSIYFFNKNEGNKQKVENKVSGRVRVGVGRALLSQ